MGDPKTGYSTPDAAPPGLSRGGGLITFLKLLATLFLMKPRKVRVCWFFTSKTNVE